MAEDLKQFEAWFARILQGMDPAHRRRATRKLGQALRRLNLLRMAANIEPDGAAMAPRKPRLDRRGKLRGRPGGKMFRRLRMIRNWKIDAQPDGVEIAPANSSTDRVAAEHHFGLTGYVGRNRNGGQIRAKYAARRLLGIGPDDELAAIEAAASLLDPGAS